MAEQKTEGSPSVRHDAKRLGWQPYTVQSFQSWCGRRQEILPFPRDDGSVVFIEIVGEAT